MLNFSSDYMEGAHPEILYRLAKTNLAKTVGYGLDEYSEAARKKIREACAAPDAEIHFLAGGTQANAVITDALLRGFQGVISAESGHVNGHEAGAIEFCGHKVIALPHENGRLAAEEIDRFMAAFNADENRDHTVQPGLVYVSQPTERGTLYSKAELQKIRAVCDRYGLLLYLDGARLAYALACKKNDLTLPDIARLCDAFYIGGTKCGALFGEAAVLKNTHIAPHFFTTVKQHGALLAKGRIAGLQFDELFSNGLYEKGGEHAIKAADRIRFALKKRGYTFAWETPTNQIFVLLDKAALARLSKDVQTGFWENRKDGTVVRIATSWATSESDVRELINIL